MLLYDCSWHLCQVLQSLGFLHLSDYHLSVIHTSYAAQLEALGLWQWAAFVLLHISDGQRYVGSMDIQRVNDV